MPAPKMILSDDMQDAMTRAGQLAFAHHHLYITPEHVLYGLLHHDDFCDAIVVANDSIDIEELIKEVEAAVIDNAIQIDGKKYDSCEASFQMAQLLSNCAMHAESAETGKITVPILAEEMLKLEESWAANILSNAIKNEKGIFIAELTFRYNEATTYQRERGDDNMQPDTYERPEERANKWKSMVTCVNDHLNDHNPLIGRGEEIERTLQVLCRKEKNNPLHIGEPGVGKSSIIYGLAERIELHLVPDRLLGSRIYQLDMGTLLAGAQFRGDLEKRVKTIMEGVTQEKNAILYIDEIHNIVGAGQGAEGGNDVANMLKPYLDGGEVRIIGATTYEGFNRQLSKRKEMIRRFQTIDIVEPTIEEAFHIVQMLAPIYEKYHHVKYEPEALRYAVEMSVKHIKDRFLPDKAIDLIDEAGAASEVFDGKRRKITKRMIAEVLAKVAHIDALAIRSNENTSLASLSKKMGSVIFGQDKAINSVVEAVQMAKAGLSDENKPLASLLFVGPTGVGKTEVARMLAKTLNVELVRFDMSEYVEKHTVAKLIGSPAGYVGYDDGGLLTDAVRKNPDCVLLLDEIEKAHSDIFNILLQVMDYGVLTDNKGRKAHFNNVILIMTSNAGAQFASQASVGFASTATAGGAMLKNVKQTFKPEFINRLTDIVVFNDMSREMASLILDKKLHELDTKLDAKKVKIKLSNEAREHLLTAGFSKEYGAREMDRVIQQQLKTVLMKEILWGALKNGGKATVALNNGKLEIEA